MRLSADKLEGKKERYFTLLFCDPEFASLAAEVVPDTSAGRVLALLFGWKTTAELQPQVKPEPKPEEKPQTFQTVHSRLGTFIHSATEIWPAIQMHNGRWVPEWVVGGREESSQRPSIFGPEEPPRMPLSLSYGDNRLKTLLDAQGRRRGIW